MTYCMQQRGQRFTSKPNLKADALEPIKASAKKRARSADATHEHRSFAETMSALATLEEFLEARGWQLMDSGAHIQDSHTVWRRWPSDHSIDRMK